MEAYLEEVIKVARATPRPETVQCAVEKYTQMTSQEVNDFILNLTTEWANDARFNRDEHADWIHSGAVTTDLDGLRLLDVFFLKYPVPALPEEDELDMEYSWKRHNKPETMVGIQTFDCYLESACRNISMSVEAYGNALKSWAELGRPTEIGDCLRNASKSELKKFQKIQVARTKAREQSFMSYQRARAPAHMQTRIEAGIYRENLALSLIRESIARL
jgi:hypothetical protein